MNRIPDDVEALRAAFQSVARIAGDGADCPSPELLWDSARGELAQAENERVVLHTGECAACAAAWRIGRELGRDAGVVSIAPRPRSSWRVWVPLAAAAVLIIAAGVGVKFGLFGGRRSDVYRTVAENWIAPAVDMPAVLSRARCTLRWTAGPAGTTYDLRVTTEDLAVLAVVRGLERPEYSLTPAALASVAPGGPIVWQVSAHLPDGRQVDSLSFINRLD